MSTSRSFARDPTLSVDAANVCDKKTWMERGLSKLRAQPWLTVVECFLENESGIGPPSTNGVV